MPNRLADETSPYLQQHKDNPVDWWPWCDEAFEEAARRDVPVLLSVGYSACHWCHVMAHESFEDADTAAIMNELFVNVKVDREERPDVDAVYMEATQAMTGGGGWPMTVFLTPDKRPFFAGTYFPKETKFGRAGFPDVMRAVHEAWANRREEVEGQADQLATAVQARSTLAVQPDRSPGGASTTAVDGTLLRRGYDALRKSFDGEWGGFGRTPKFPQVSFLELVVRAHTRERSGPSMHIIETTLDAMASGGIYDHLGGGFARYSVDAFWMVPHFEKMLYDQAQLLRAYLHGWQLTGNENWKQVVEEIVDYVLRDLHDVDSGGLYSAEDADSEGEEGKFYVWRIEELADVLDPHGLTDEAVQWYGVTKAGNFEGSNILHRPDRGKLVRPPAIERARQLLFDKRNERVRPGLDDKILTEWNAMFVSALAEAGAAMQRTDWLDAAATTAQFLLDHLRPEGRWRRAHQRGRTNERLLAYAVDHAWLVDAFTRLAEARGEARWIDAARQTADEMVDLFWDACSGGFFTTGHDAEQLIVRQKEYYDGATPSANAVAAMALLRLGALTGNAAYTEAAEKTITWLADGMRVHPEAFTASIAAADFLVSGPTEIVIPGTTTDTQRLVAAVQQRYLPNAVVAHGERYDSPLWEGRDDGLAYVCRNYACRAPAADVDTLIRALGAE
ncbi:MAG TPA: thioredoxin domain-containing protein [Acidimicrobiales bacterium]|nr:thioredoxin domain-containing protein [Acidimicrobiales bacterium]